jgi:lysylphosphatidylglycerol synthetase-like protein (DUF2156 family)
MMMIAVAIVVAAFVLLLLVRLAGARRVVLLERWPTVVLGLAAVLALARGQMWFALGLAGAATAAWLVRPPKAARVSPAAHANPEDEAARRILGVGPQATAQDIRAAYRAKIAKAHPDRGGSHADAARLTAARDRLLKR